MLVNPRASVNILEIGTMPTPVLIAVEALVHRVQFASFHIIDETFDLDVLWNKRRGLEKGDVVADRLLQV